MVSYKFVVSPKELEEAISNVSSEFVSSLHFEKAKYDDLFKIRSANIQKKYTGETTYN